MTFLNNYTAPEPLAISNYHSDTPLESYDLNHCYPFTLNVNEGGLSSDGGVKLYPLIPSIHAERLFKLFEPHPESYRWLPYGPFTKNYSKFLTFLETCRRDPQTLLFVVYDLSLDFDEQQEQEPEKEEEDFNLQGGKGLNLSRIAGIVGILKSNPQNRSTEIGHLHISPTFQKTHVLTHSISILLKWLLDPPTTKFPFNLGLRRVQWFANNLNLPSIRAAERLGFELESDCLKWERITRPEKEGRDLPSFLYEQGNEERKLQEEKRGKGRHSSVLSLDWERWESGGRANIDKLLEREVKRRNVSELDFGEQQESRN